MHRLSYISPVLSFAAAFAAILGPAHLENVNGLRGITSFGWAVISIAILSLIITLVDTRQQALEKQLEQKKAENAEKELLEVKAHSNMLLKKAEIAEKELSEVKAHSNRLLKAGVDRIYKILDFAYLLSYLGNPEDPKNIREDSPPAVGLFSSMVDPLSGKHRGEIKKNLTPESRNEISFLSEEKISSLKKFNYLPRRSFKQERFEDSLARRPDVLNPQDPHETSVPFAIDKRQFQTIISKESALAIQELESALERAGYIAFDAKVLKLAKTIIQHPFIQRLTRFEASIERFLRIEDLNDKSPKNDANVSEPRNMEFWESYKVSLIVDNGIQIGASLLEYRDFVKQFIELRELVN